MPLFLVLALAGVDAAAAASADERYLHTVERGETIYGIAHHLLEPPVRWRELASLNGITRPKRLQPGRTLEIPVDWLRRESLEATVVAAEGEARAERGGVTIELTPGARLPPGTRISTGSAGAVALRLADGTTLQMQAATEVELLRLQRVIDPATHDDRLEVRKGRIAIAATPRKGPAAKLEVVTPRAVAGVRGTDFRVGAGERASQVEVLDGGVASRGVEANAPPVEVAAGEGVVFDPETVGAPRVVKLLPAPRIDAPAAPVVETIATIGFDAVAAAAGYRARLARDAGFERVIDEQVIGGPRYRTPELPDGAYWLRVRAIDGSGLEGFEALAAFAIAGRPRPPFSLVAPERGRQRPALLRFEWTGAPGAVAYRFQLASDRALTALLREEPRVAATALDVALPLTDADYHWRLASIAADGRQGPWSEVFTLERRPQPAALEVPAVGDDAVSLHWSGVDGQAYRVQVARDPTFTGEIREFSTREPQLRLPRPESGAHFVRVQDVDAAGSGGPWSEPQRLEIPVDYTPLLLLLLFAGALLL